MKNTFFSIFGNSLLIITCGLFTAGCPKKTAYRDGPEDVKAEPRPDETDKPFSCKALAEKNRNCVDELVETLMATVKGKIPESQEKEVAEVIRRNTLDREFEEQCEKHAHSGDARDAELIRQFAQCLQMDDCSQYAECISKITQSLDEDVADPDKPDTRVEIDCEKVADRIFKDCFEDVLRLAGNATPEDMEKLKASGKIEGIATESHQRFVLGCIAEKGKSPDGERVNECMKKESCEDFAECIKPLMN